MKFKKINTTFVIIGVMILCSFTAINVYQVKKNTAEVKQHEGVYVFIDSEPINEYSNLGNIKAPIRLGGDYRYTIGRDKMLKKLKKVYPSSDGMIIHLKLGRITGADAIKFK